MNDFDIPDTLNDNAKKIAKAITKHITNHIAKVYDQEPSGGGCRAFYSPQEFLEKGIISEIKDNMELIICHDGGDADPFFNDDYQKYSWIEGMNNTLREFGVCAERYNSWFSIIFRD